MFSMVLDIVVEAWIEDTSSCVRSWWSRWSNECGAAASFSLQLYQGFLLPRSLLMTPSFLTRSLVEPPSWRPLSLPTHPPPSFLTSSMLLLAVLGLSGHHDPVDGRLHPLGLGVEHDGGLAAVDLDSLPYLPH